MTENSVGKENFENLSESDQQRIFRLIVVRKYNFSNYEKIIEEVMLDVYLYLTNKNFEIPKRFQSPWSDLCGLGFETMEEVKEKVRTITTHDIIYFLENLYDLDSDDWFIPIKINFEIVIKD